MKTGNRTYRRMRLPGISAFQRSVRTRSHHEVMILKGLGHAQQAVPRRSFSKKMGAEPDRNTACHFLIWLKMRTLMFKTVNI